MNDLALPWPNAITSFNWHAPEAPLQIPMAVFEKLVFMVRADKRPRWTNEALLSKQKGLCLPAKTFYELMDAANYQDVPSWMKDWEDWGVDDPDWMPESEKEHIAQCEREDELARAQGKLLHTLRELVPPDWEGHPDEWVAKALFQLSNRAGRYLGQEGQNGQ